MELQEFEVLTLSQSLSELNLELSSMNVTLVAKLKDYKQSSIELVKKEVLNTFKEIKLSNEFISYAQLLLVQKAVKENKKQLKIEINKNYNKNSNLTFEQRTVVSVFYANLVDIALNEVNKEVKKMSLMVEKNFHCHLNSDFNILGTDFSSLSKELKQTLYGKASPFENFKTLVLDLYSANLSGKAIKKIKDSIIYKIKEVMNENVLTTDEIENITVEEKMEWLEKANKRYSSKNIEEKFHELNGKWYVELTEELESILLDINEIFKDEKEETTNNQ